MANLRQRWQSSIGPCHNAREQGGVDLLAIARRRILRCISIQLNTSSGDMDEEPCHCQSRAI